MKRHALIVVAFLVIVTLLAAAGYIIDLLAVSAPLVVLVVGLPALTTIFVVGFFHELDR